MIEFKLKGHTTLANRRDHKFERTLKCFGDEKPADIALKFLIHSGMAFNYLGDAVIMVIDGVATEYIVEQDDEGSYQLINGCGVAATAD